LLQFFAVQTNFLVLLFVFQITAFHSRFITASSVKKEKLQYHQQISNKMSASNPHRPLCSFGVITDIHYADSDDCSNYEGTRQRSFRRSSQLVETAVTEWSAIQDSPVDFVLQLGDLIDGRNFSMNASDAALNVMIQQFSRLHQPIYHIFGNHELYNFSRAHLLQHPWLRVSPNVATPNPGHTAHYHFSPVEGFRVVILDQYEFSMLGYEEDDETFRQALYL
jgi:manganese-dependent ADP-ribose/CDP-alcohol diphosphatase